MNRQIELIEKANEDASDLGRYYKETRVIPLPSAAEFQIQ